MTQFAAKELTMGQVNALVRMIGGEKNALKILSGELKIRIEETGAQTAYVDSDGSRWPKNIGEDFIYGANWDEEEFLPGNR